MTLIIIGLLLGIRHAFEPDHLAAVSTLATRPGSHLWSAARLGLVWGVGHTVTVGVLAFLLVGLGLHLPASLWPAGELVVARSEEHTSELQSQSNLVCRLLL